MSSAASRSSAPEPRSSCAQHLPGRLLPREYGAVYGGVLGVLPCEKEASRRRAVSRQRPVNARRLGELPIRDAPESQGTEVHLRIPRRQILYAPAKKLGVRGVEARERYG